MSNNVKKYDGLVTPGLNRKIQCREYPPNQRYMVRPPKSKVEESVGALQDKYYSFSTDENGFINPQYCKIGADKQVVFLGGSTTECIWNEEAVRWPNLVAKIFNERSNNFKLNSINSGVWGNTTAQSINLMLNKILANKPDICGLMHNINDLVLFIHEGDYWKASHPVRKLLTRSEYDGLTNRSIVKKSLGSLLFGSNHCFKFDGDDAYHETRKKQSMLDPDTFVDQFRANIEIFISICKSHRVKPVLFTQANRLTLEPDMEIYNHVEQMLASKGLSYEQVQGYYRQLNSVIKLTARQHSCCLIDLDRIVPKTREYMFDSVHLTDLGCKFVAEIVASELQGIV